MKLGEIAEIKTGLVMARKRPKHDTAASYNVITVKSITDSGEIDSSELDYFKSGEEIDPEYLTKEGDIVMRLSEPNTAAYINSENEKLLVTSYCCFIRVKSGPFLPEFLVWYLNSGFCKKQTRKFSTGSSLGFLTTSLLKSIDIPVISQARQEKIIEIYRLSAKERRLYEELTELRTDLVKGLMQELIKN